MNELVFAYQRRSAAKNSVYKPKNGVPIKAWTKGDAVEEAAPKWNRRRIWSKSFTLCGRKIRGNFCYFPFCSAAAAGFSNFLSSTGTFCCNSAIWIVKRPSGRATVH